MAKQNNSKSAKSKNNHQTNSANRKVSIDFAALRKPMLILSCILVLSSAASIVFKQFNFGIDFTGGTLLELEFAESPQIDAIRSQLKAAGLNAKIQLFGTTKNLIIRLNTETGSQNNNADISSLVLEALDNKFDKNQITIKRIEFVGSQVSEELATDGSMAVLFTLLGILVYIAFRFEYRFAFGAVFAIVHDVIITLGIFSFFQLEFDLPVLAAILAVIGYSLNDTIVIFDRVRDNFYYLRNLNNFQIMNISANQSIARTIMTSVTTLLVLIALFIFGGDLIKNFAVALIIGVIVGTYSSIYIATSLSLMLGVSQEHFLEKVKQKTNQDKAEAEQQAQFLASDKKD